MFMSLARISPGPTGGVCICADRTGSEDRRLPFEEPPLLGVDGPEGLGDESTALEESHDRMAPASFDWFCSCPGLSGRFKSNPDWSIKIIAIKSSE